MIALLTSASSILAITAAILEIIRDERDPLNSHRKIINLLENKIDEIDGQINNIDLQIKQFIIDNNHNDTEKYLIYRNELVNVKEKCLEIIERRKKDINDTRLEK